MANNLPKTVGLNPLVYGDGVDPRGEGADREWMAYTTVTDGRGNVSYLYPELRVELGLDQPLPPDVEQSFSGGSPER